MISLDGVTRLGDPASAVGVGWLMRFASGKSIHRSIGGRGLFDHLFQRRGTSFDLLEAVHAKGEHAIVQRHLSKFVGAGIRHDHLPDRRVDKQDTLQISNSSSVSKRFFWFSVRIE